MKAGKTLVELAQELQRRAESKVDFVAKTEALYVEPNAQTLVVTPDTGSAASYPMTPYFQGQLGSWAGIPAKYAAQMRESAPALLAVNFNEWLHNPATRANRMIRVLDQNARAFLSDRYHRVDNEDIAQAVLPVLLESEEIRVVSCDVTDSRLYLKALFPKVEAEVKVGDAVQAGVMISNSEIGMGRVVVQPWSIAWCARTGWSRTTRGCRVITSGGASRATGGMSTSCFATRRWRRTTGR